MREILFRGKTESGEWVEGYYFKTPLTEESVWGAKCENGLYFCCGIDERHCISNENGCVWSVIPSTIGQYTGLTDKNGTKIFCGDIVRTDTIEDCHVEYWEQGWCAYVLVGEIKRFEGYLADYDNCEVIGNIHDEVKYD